MTTEAVEFQYHDVWLRECPFIDIIRLLGRPHRREKESAIWDFDKIHVLCNCSFAGPGKVLFIAPHTSTLEYAYHVNDMLLKLGVRPCIWNAEREKSTSRE